MKKARTICRVMGAWFALAVFSPAWAFDTVVSDAACRIEGFSRPLRQTIVLLDEAAIDVFTSGKASEANRLVNRTLLGLAGMLEGQTVSAIDPRERITIVFAREDGSDIVRVFTGCPPVYTEEEIVRLSQSSRLQEQLLKFLGKDVRSRLE